MAGANGEGEGRRKGEGRKRGKGVKMGDIAMVVGG